MKRSKIDGRRNGRDIFALRKRCAPSGSGLTHYLLLSSAPRPAAVRSALPTPTRQAAES